MTPRARRILWLDSLGALLAGVLVLGLRERLAHLYGLPLALVTAMGLVNLVYGCGSGALARQASRGTRPARRWVDLLIAGNLAWAGVCVILAATWWTTVSPWGLLQLLGEGAYVGALGLVERRWVRPESAAVSAA
jgi:hypothetical protein